MFLHDIIAPMSLEEAKAKSQRLDPKCWTGKHKEGTKVKGGVRVNNCVPNNEAANPAQQAAIAIAKKKQQGVAEGSEIQIPTEDGITMQDIRLMAGEGPLTKKTVLQAIAVIRKQRRQKGVAEGRLDELDLFDKQKTYFKMGNGKWIVAN